jgi:hypothetical protein
MSDASPSSGPTNIHDYVPEDDVSIVMDTDEILFEEQAEMMDMAADSKIMIFSYREGCTSLETPWHQSKP